MGLLLYTMVLISLLTVLWNISSVARCYLKYVYFGICSTFSAITPIPLMLLNPRSSKNALLPAASIRACCRLIGISISLEGEENIIQNSGCVVLINHQSMLDLLVLARLWPAMPNCTVIAKKEILYFQPFALAAWLWGTIFIDRVQKAQAQAEVNRTGEIIQKRRARVLMFPEGTRSRKDQLLPFKKGAFHLAIASKCPIQPVAVNRYQFLGKHRFDTGEIRIRILPAIPTIEYDVNSIQQLMDITYKVMSDNVNDLTNQVLDTNKRK